MSFRQRRNHIMRFLVPRNDNEKLTKLAFSIPKINRILFFVLPTKEESHKNILEMRFLVPRNDKANTHKTGVFKTQKTLESHCKLISCATKLICCARRLFLLLIKTHIVAYKMHNCWARKKNCCASFLQYF